MINCENDSATIGDLISGLRRLAGISQSELAEKIKISKLTLLKIEKNISKPKMETLEKIAKFYGITVSQMMMLVERVNTNDSEKSELIDKLFCRLITKK